MKLANRHIHRVIPQTFPIRNVSALFFFSHAFNTFIDFATYASEVNRNQLGAVHGLKSK